MMLATRSAGLAERSEARTLGLRVGVVGLNFAVMLGLAALLGLETFGRLAALWGGALVVSTVVSLGGPVILLRMLTDGQGMRIRDICSVILIFPALLALVVYFIALHVWPAFPWAAILSAGVLANVLACLASVMRALGSVQASMALRDAGPQSALGAAGIWAYGNGPDTILMSAAATMLAMALCGTVWVCRHRSVRAVLSSDRRPFWSVSLWAASVSGMVVAQIDLIAGGAVISAEELGVYAILRRVANLVALPVSVATWVNSPAVSAAFGAGDRPGLARASAHGSQMAILPGLVLFAVACLAVPMLPYLIAQDSAEGWDVVFGILLLGAFGQVVFASSFGVATLCKMPAYAMTARLLMILFYLSWFAWWGAELTATTNALGYAGAITLGGIALWWAVKRQLGVDTSAAVLLRGKGWRWKAS